MTADGLEFVMWVLLLLEGCTVVRMKRGREAERCWWQKLQLEIQTCAFPVLLQGKRLCIVWRWRDVSATSTRSSCLKGFCVLVLSVFSLTYSPWQTWRCCLTNRGSFVEISTVCTHSVWLLRQWKRVRENNDTETWGVFEKLFKFCLLSGYQHKSADFLF